MRLKTPKHLHQTSQMYKKMGSFYRGLFEIWKLNCEEVLSVLLIRTNTHSVTFAEVGGVRQTDIASFVP
jgi:hypothetical protein